MKDNSRMDENLTNLLKILLMFSKNLKCKTAKLSKNEISEEI